MFVRDGIRSNNRPDGMTVRGALKVCSAAALVMLVIFALGPAKWTPRSGLGFEFDHFVGYFFFHCCSVSPSRGHLRSGSLAVLAVVLENLQSFLPGRSSYFVAALYKCRRGAGGGATCRVFHSSTEVVSIKVN
jgi:VanZ family protein